MYITSVSAKLCDLNLPASPCDDTVSASDDLSLFKREIFQRGRCATLRFSAPSAHANKFERICVRTIAHARTLPSKCSFQCDGWALCEGKL